MTATEQERLEMREELAEAEELASKMLRYRFDHSPEAIEAMDRADLLRALKEEAGQE